MFAGIPPTGALITPHSQLCSPPALQVWFASLSDALPDGPSNDPEEDSSTSISPPPLWALQREARFAMPMLHKGRAECRMQNLVESPVPRQGGGQPDLAAASNRCAPLPHPPRKIFLPSTYVPAYNLLQIRYTICWEHEFILNNTAHLLLIYTALCWSLNITGGDFVTCETAAAVPVNLRPCSESTAPVCCLRAALPCSCH